MDRKRAKTRAKRSLKRNYGGIFVNLVVASVPLIVASIISRILGGIGQAAFKFNPAIGLVATVVVSILSFIITLLVSSYVSVAQAVVSKRTADKQAIEGFAVTVPYEEGWAGLCMRTMISYHLHVTIWLLLPIAGFFVYIVKSLKFALVPYILTENVDMEPRDVLDLSAEMMDGHKGELFVTYLSFFGWYIVGTITCGIAFLFWVAPYLLLTVGQVYTQLRDLHENGEYATDDDDEEEERPRKKKKAPAKKAPAKKAPVKKAPAKKAAPKRRKAEDYDDDDYEDEEEEERPRKKKAPAKKAPLKKAPKRRKAEDYDDDEYEEDEEDYESYDSEDEEPYDDDEE